MMSKKMIAGVFILIINTTLTQAQKSSQDSTFRRFFIGSTLFMLGNLTPDDPNPPDFVQLNFGYRLTPKDVISIEAKTWKYAWPLGIPYGKSYNAPPHKYPGYTRDFGIALAYQRFWWKGLYTAVHAMNALQKYYDEDNKHITDGYQLFMTYRLGYHISFFRKRLFLEPSVAMTHWPVKTNTPESFARMERPWPNYFPFEPGLHFGLNF